LNLKIIKGGNMEKIKLKELSTSTKVLLFITGGTILISILLILLMSFGNTNVNSNNSTINQNSEYSAPSGNNPFEN
jgi:hypothetical protein